MFIAFDNGVVEAAELIACGVKELVEHHRIWYTGEVLLSIPV
jgi:hypothetical protein